MHLQLRQRSLFCITIVYIRHLRHPTNTSTDGSSSIHDDATSSFFSSVVDKHEQRDDDEWLGEDLPLNLWSATTDSAVLAGDSSLTLLPFLFIILGTSDWSRGILFIFYSLSCFRWGFNGTDGFLNKYVCVYIKGCKGANYDN